MMKTFRYTTTVNAVQWHGEESILNDIFGSDRWERRDEDTVIVFSSQKMPDSWLYPGDWIVEDTSGALSVYTADEFAMMFAELPQEGV